MINAKTNGLNILLISGLSVRRVNSFSVQLSMLSNALQSLGCTSLVLGHTPRSGHPRLVANRRGTDDAVGMQPRDLPDFSAKTLEKVAEDFSPDALILLGYPDQFPFLTQAASIGLPPIFLWAQVSRTPDDPDFEADSFSGTANIIVVPLTERTRSYITGGVSVTDPIPHGVDTKAFKPISDTDKHATRDEYGVPQDAFVFGYVGTNQLRKRFDRLLDAFSLIHARFAGTHLLIKSDSPSKSGGFDLDRIIGTLGIASSVTVISGSVETKAMARMLGCIDAYLHVSEWEGFGIPVIEALACGVPVITHEGQGPGEITPFPQLLVSSELIENDSGAELRYIGLESVADIAEGLIQQTAADRKRLSDIARNTACNLYDARKVAEKWIDLIQGYK